MLKWIAIIVRTLRSALRPRRELALENLDGATSAEREELRRLRRDNKRLRQERSFTEVNA